MFLVGCVGFVCVGGIGCLDIVMSVIGEVGKMSRCFVIVGERGEGVCV